MFKVTSPVNPYEVTPCVACLVAIIYVSNALLLNFPPLSALVTRSGSNDAEIFVPRPKEKNQEKDIQSEMQSEGETYCLHNCVATTIVKFTLHLSPTDGGKFNAKKLNHIWLPDAKISFAELFWVCAWLVGGCVVGKSP